MEVMASSKEIIMQDLFIVFKSLVMLCITWFTSVFIDYLVILAILPTWLNEFFTETKEALSWIVSFSILILTVVKIINANKKDKE